MAHIRVDTTELEQIQEQRSHPLRGWGFRKSYPTGVKKGKVVTVRCRKCGKTYSSDVRLPAVRDRKFEPCDNMSFGQRCMGTDYELNVHLEIEAMPIGRVVLPTKGKEW